MSTINQVSMSGAVPSGVLRDSAGYRDVMSQHEIDTVLAWRGRTVYDRDGEKIGTLDELFLEGESARPAYGGVRTGLFGRKTSIFPLEGVREEEGNLVVPYEKDVVSDAPNLEPDAELSPEEADALHEHYGIQAERDKPDPFTEGVVRSEEEPQVTGTERVPSERVRIRRVQVTDEVPVTTPVRKEVVQLESEPPPAGQVESVEEVEDARDPQR
jgi:PRC-barrel domain